MFNIIVWNISACVIFITDCCVHKTDDTVSDRNSAVGCTHTVGYLTSDIDNAVKTVHSSKSHIIKEKTSEQYIQHMSFPHENCFSEFQNDDNQSANGNNNEYKDPNCDLEESLDGIFPDDHKCSNETQLSEENTHDTDGNSPRNNRNFSLSNQIEDSCNKDNGTSRMHKAGCLTPDIVFDIVHTSQSPVKDKASDPDTQHVMLFPHANCSNKFQNDEGESSHGHNDEYMNSMNKPGVSLDVKSSDEDIHTKEAEPSKIDVDHTDGNNSRDNDNIEQVKIKEDQRAGHLHFIELTATGNPVEIISTVKDKVSEPYFKPKMSFPHEHFFNKFQNADNESSHDNDNEYKDPNYDLEESLDGCFPDDHKCSNAIQPPENNTQGTDGNNSRNNNDFSLNNLSDDCWSKGEGTSQMHKAGCLPSEYYNIETMKNWTFWAVHWVHVAGLLKLLLLGESVVRRYWQDDQKGQPSMKTKWPVVREVQNDDNECSNGNDNEYKDPNSDLEKSIDDLFPDDHKCSNEIQPHGTDGNNSRNNSDFNQNNLSDDCSSKGEGTSQMHKVGCLISDIVETVYNSQSPMKDKASNPGTLHEILCAPANCVDKFQNDENGNFNGDDDEYKNLNYNTGERLDGKCSDNHEPANDTEVDVDHTDRSNSKDNDNLEQVEIEVVFLDDMNESNCAVADIYSDHCSTESKVATQTHTVGYLSSKTFYTSKPFMKEKSSEQYIEPGKLFLRPDCFNAFGNDEIGHSKCDDNEYKNQDYNPEISSHSFAHHKYLNEIEPSEKDVNHTGENNSKYNDNFDDSNPCKDCCLKDEGECQAHPARYLTSKYNAEDVHTLKSLVKEKPSKPYNRPRRSFPDGNCFSEYQNDESEHSDVDENKDKDPDYRTEESSDGYSSDDAELPKEIDPSEMVVDHTHENNSRNNNSFDQSSLAQDFGLPSNSCHNEINTNVAQVDDVSTSLVPKKLRLFQRKQVKSGCKQVYDKVNFCTFCGEEIHSKIARHLLSKQHQDQTIVTDILMMPKKSSERRAQLSILANEGNFKHNMKVLASNEGAIVVGRRSGHDRKEHCVTDFLPCEYCRKFILKTSLYLHHKNCNVMKYYAEERQKKNEGCLEAVDGNDKNDEGNVIQNNAVRRARHLLNSALLDDDQKLASQMLNRMTNDTIKLVVQNDKLIMWYSALRVESLGEEADQKQSDIYRVSQGSRTLARLVMQCRLTKPAATLDDLISGENFDLVVSATKKLAFTDNQSYTLARFIGNLLGHVTQIKIGKALRSADSIKLQDATNFQKIFEAEWNYRVNSVGVKKMNTLKRNTLQVIPLTEDLITFRSFLQNSISETSSSLKNDIKTCTWIKLSKLIMVRLIVFNKRRRAEVKELKITDYTERPNWKDERSGEMQLAMSSTDKIISHR